MDWQINLITHFCLGVSYCLTRRQWSACHNEHVYLLPTVHRANCCFFCLCPCLANSFFCIFLFVCLDCQCACSLVPFPRSQYSNSGRMRTFPPWRHLWFAVPHSCWLTSPSFPIVQALFFRSSTSDCLQINSNHLHWDCLFACETIPNWSIAYIQYWWIH